MKRLLDSTTGKLLPFGKQDLGCAVSNFPWSTDLISSLSALKCPLPSTDSSDGNDNDYDIGRRHGTTIIRSNSYSTDFVDDQLNRFVMKYHMM